MPVMPLFPVAVTYSLLTRHVDMQINSTGPLGLRPMKISWNFRSTEQARVGAVH